MTRAHNPDDICAMCDEYDRDSERVDPAYRKIGMGICQKHVDTLMYDLVYVAWNNQTCVSFRFDRPNLAQRRQFVALQQSKETPP